jgi:hypothetical protein
MVDWLDLLSVLIVHDSLVSSEGLNQASWISQN